MSQFSKSTNYLLLLFISMMVVIGCKKQNYGVDNFDDQGFQSYVYAYTSGMVSKAAPIRVRFTQALVSADDVGKPVKDNLISFSPKIKGTMIWEDEQTILVQANNQLPSNTKYTGSVRLSNIFSNVPGQLKTFKFGFATLEQHAEVLVEGLRSADLTDLKKQEVFGTVYTADVAKADEVEKVLIVKQSGNSNLKVNWQHDGDQQNHYFTVQNVKRGNNASEVKVEWSGKPLGISEKGDEKIEVPALGDFKVMDVQVNQEEGSGQHYSIFFSDPIKKTQNLNGLIKFQKLSAKFTFTIDGNIVKAYPNKFVMGDRTVEVSRGIKNIANKSMPNPSQWSLTFASAKPQVKMLRKGAIMPNSNGLILPFEAVSLNAVDVEIFKIYEGNVLQFLQTNDLSGGYDLKRVGRVVYQKTVALNSLNSKFDANKWTQYALNLKDYINREPNAIYQVRIGFKKVIGSLYE